MRSVTLLVVRLADELAGFDTQTVGQFLQVDEFEIAAPLLDEVQLGTADAELQSES